LGLLFPLAAEFPSEDFELNCGYNGCYGVLLISVVGGGDSERTKQTLSIPLCAGRKNYRECTEAVFHGIKLFTKKRDWMEALTV
jgi:hypothetical protein